MKEKEILHVLPREIRGLIEEEGLDYRYLQEIKLRTGKPLLLLYQGGEVLAGKKKGQPHFVTREEMREMMEYLQRMLYQMQSEIRYLRAPLGDIAGRIGRESRDPYKKWLLSLEREMKQRDGKSFSTLWEQGVRKHLGDLHFPEREISRLCALGSQIGNADMEFQMRTLSLYQEQLAQTLEELRRTMDGKVKLCRSIGVIGGIFLVILLL